MNCNRVSPPRLGIDIGGVIISPSVDDSSDTSFFAGTMSAALMTPPSVGVFEHLPVLVQRFEQNVWLISKAGPVIQAKTLRWLDHHRFYERTGVPRGNIRFCRQRAEKADHCRELWITHFIDDRRDVLQHLEGLVSHRYLFGPPDGKLSDPLVRQLASWSEANIKVWPASI